MSKQSIEEVRAEIVARVAILVGPYGRPGIEAPTGREFDRDLDQLGLLDRAADILNKCQAQAQAQRTSAQGIGQYKCCKGLEFFPFHEEGCSKLKRGAVAITVPIGQYRSTPADEAAGTYTSDSGSYKCSTPST